ncbi:MAG: molybdopterin-dependent oxidoreductase, partial [Thermoanaerobaculia bacterium]|nr:molybdopterin-dependent oxidoreductase [Thermoanaerobaculia bacterium]
PGKVAHGTAGDAAAALARSARTLAAVYELPYLAHAPMEPLNCVADVRADRCEIWVGTQSQTIDRNAAASAAGLEPEQVTLHTTLLGGGFGRRAVLDSHFVVEAVQVSKAVKRPVKVIWTREDDIRGGYFRPRAVHAVQGGVDAAGKVQAWHHRIVCQSIVAGTMFESAMFRDGVDESAVEGVSDMAYAIPHRQVEWHQAPAGIPVLWWRSVGHAHTAFAVESFLDELAHAAGRDPLAVRLELLAEAPRHRRVLELAAAKAGWGNAAPAGRGRGLAVHASFGSFVAQVAEVSVSAKGAIRVHRVVAAIDCGPVVNPETIRAQVEGAIVYGLSAALHGQITFAKGRVQQSNFHDYPALRMSEMPEVEVHIVESGERMGGVGEPGLPPIAPAVANAVFAATGQRLRRLPFRLAAPA